MAPQKNDRSITAHEVDLTKNDKSKQFEKEKNGGIKRTGTMITARQFEKSTEITDESKMQASGT